LAGTVEVTVDTVRSGARKAALAVGVEPDDSAGAVLVVATDEPAIELLLLLPHPASPIPMIATAGTQNLRIRPSPVR